MCPPLEKYLATGLRNTNSIFKGKKVGNKRTQVCASNRENIFFSKKNEENTGKIMSYYLFHIYRVYQSKIA